MVLAGPRFAFRLATFCTTGRGINAMTSHNCNDTGRQSGCLLTWPFGHMIFLIPDQHNLLMVSLICVDKPEKLIKAFCQRPLLYRFVI